MFFLGWGVHTNFHIKIITAHNSVQQNITAHDHTKQNQMDILVGMIMTSPEFGKQTCVNCQSFQRLMELAIWITSVLRTWLKPDCKSACPTHTTQSSPTLLGRVRLLPSWLSMWHNSFSIWFCGYASCIGVVIQLLLLLRWSISLAYSQVTLSCTLPGSHVTAKVTQLRIPALSLLSLVEPSYLLIEPGSDKQNESWQ